MFPRSAFVWFTCACLGAALSLHAAPETEKATRLEIGEARLGNVYLPAENPVTLPVRWPATADRVTWQLKDLWGGVAASGELARADLAENGFQLALPYPGWFSLEMKAWEGGRTLAQGEAELVLLSSPPPENRQMSPFGVMTHFGQNWKRDILEVFEKMGAGTIRDGLDWTNVEKEKGVYKLSAGYDAAITEAVERKMKPLHVLAFGNDLYYKTPGVPVHASAPYTQEDYEAYARYCVEMINLLGERGEWVEIWNEYNGTYARGPASGRPEIYAEMLKIAYKAIKAKHPKTFVLGCSAIGVPLTWIESIFKNGGLQAMDGVSIHPYGYTMPPETLEQRVAPLRDLIRRYNGGKDKPIWVTEQGYYLIKEGARGNASPLDEAVKAAYLVRAWVVLLGLGVDKIYWYLGKNYDQYGDMGLVGSEKDPRGKYAPKPALAAYGTLIRALGNGKFVRREESPEGVYCYLFEKEGKPVRVLWSPEKDQSVAMACSGPAKFTDFMGKPFELNPINGQVHIQLSGAPIFLSGEISGPLETSSLHLKGPQIVSKDEAVPFELEGKIPGTRIHFSSPSLSEELRSAAGKRTGVEPARGITGEFWIPFQVASDGKPVFAGTRKSVVRPPVMVDRFPKLIDRQTLQTTVTNFATQKAATLTKIDWKVGEETGTLSQKERLAPGGTIDCQIALQARKPFTIYPVEIAAAFEDGAAADHRTSVSLNPVPWKTLSLKQPMEKWMTGDSISLEGLPYKKLDGQYEGATDLGGNIWLAMDGDHVYIAARIHDDVHFQEYTGSNLWRGDCIQIGLSADRPSSPRGSSKELSAALSKEGAVINIGGNPVENAQIAVARSENWTDYRMIIPWKALGEVQTPLQHFSIAFFINDNDGAGRKGYLQWGDIKAPHQLQLCEPAKPAP